MTIPEELRIAYIRSAGEKLATLGRLWGVAMASEWAPQTIADLKEFTHRLAGSGGSYGFPDISETARQLELLLKNTDSPRQSLPSLQAAYQELEQVLSRLERDEN